MQDNINSWEDWKLHYHDELNHIAGYEKRFVDTILQKIPELSHQDVVPQYHFVDSNHKNRYIDFVIQNEVHNWNIAIELDGLAKLISKEYVEDYKQTYRRFDDMLCRQNDIIHHGFMLLRFTNKTIMDKPDYVIECIQKALEYQSNMVTTIPEHIIVESNIDYKEQTGYLKLRITRLEDSLDSANLEISILETINRAQEKLMNYKNIPLRELNEFKVYSGKGFINN